MLDQALKQDAEEMKRTCGVGRGQRSECRVRGHKGSECRVRGHKSLDAGLEVIRVW